MAKKGKTSKNRNNDELIYKASAHFKVEVWKAGKTFAYDTMLSVGDSITLPGKPDADEIQEMVASFHAAVEEAREQLTGG